MVARASLNPSTFSDDGELQMFPIQLAVNFDRQIRNRDWLPEDTTLKAVHIQACHPLIRDNLKFLAGEYSKNMSDIGRFALHFGIKLLWDLKGIEEIRNIRNFVHKNSSDQEDRDFFSSGKFGALQSPYAKALHMEFYQKDVKQCDGLASELGLNVGTTRQLAIMAILIHAQNIPYGDRQEMIQILREFKAWIEHRVQKARELKTTVEIRMQNSQVQIEKDTSWLDVIEGG